VKGCPGEAGRDDDPRERLRAAARGRPMGIGMSSRSASPAERKGVSLYVTRQVYAPEVVDIGGSAGVTPGDSTATQARFASRWGSSRCLWVPAGSAGLCEAPTGASWLCASVDSLTPRDVPVCSVKALEASKRPATLRCARSGGPGPSAAGRAPATGGSRTSGGVVAVRFAVEAVACGAVGCRESAGLLELRADGERRVLCPAHASRWSA